MARTGAKKKSGRPRDLPLGRDRSRAVKAGKQIPLKPAVFDVDVIKAPPPSGPVPMPYPN